MADVTLKTTFKLRRGTNAEWVSSNPVLAQGEPGFITDSGILKIGDGVTNFLNLQPINGSVSISGDGVTIELDAQHQIKLKGFNAAAAKSGLRKKADGSIEWIEILSKDEITAEITELENTKLNILPKVDDPTDPGFGWEYHIPYRFDVSLDAEKAEVDLHTLTLDNKVTKMTFSKQIPSATTTMAGLMAAADKVTLNNKQDKLTAGTNITIDENNVISATGGSGSTYTAGNGINIADNTISTNIGNGLKHTEDGKMTLKIADSTINVGEFGVRVPYVSTSLDNTTNGLAVKLADNTIEAYNSGTGTKGLRVNQNVIQSKLTAGTNITIDENNVISASGGSSVEFDNKTIIKGTDDKYQTAVGGWKETTPEQVTELFVNTKGNGLPTYLGPSASPTIYEVGWDYTTRISDLITGSNASININVTILGTNFNGKVALTKSASIPANWESDTITIGGKGYKVKIGEGWVGINQGGLTIMANDPSTDISDSTMASCALVTTPSSTVYHPIDNKFLNLDNSLSSDEDNKLKVNTEVIQSKLTAGSNITIVDNVISATGGSSTLQSDLTTNIAVGGVAAGTTFTAGTSLESILRAMLYSAPVGTTKLYYGVAATIPDSVQGMTAVDTTKTSLIENGYTYKNVTTSNQYVMVAIDKSLGVVCYEFTESGFSLGFITKDLGNQILYYLDSPTTGTGARYVLHFEEA